MQLRLGWLCPITGLTPSETWNCSSRSLDDIVRDQRRIAAMILVRHAVGVRTMVGEARYAVMRGQLIQGT